MDIKNNQNNDTINRDQGDLQMDSDFGDALGALKEAGEQIKRGVFSGNGCREISSEFPLETDDPGFKNENANPFVNELAMVELAVKKLKQEKEELQKAASSLKQKIDQLDAKQIALAQIKSKLLDLRKEIIDITKSGILTG